MDKRHIDILRTRVESIKIGFDQRPPCSPGCYSHVTHPCESCGRLMGHIPAEWIMHVDVPAFLDALEEAQKIADERLQTIREYAELTEKKNAKIAFLQESRAAAHRGQAQAHQALRQLEPLCQSVSTVVTGDGWVGTVTVCVVCNAKFPGGEHTEICPFASLKGGDKNGSTTGGCTVG